MMYHMLKFGFVVRWKYQKYFLSKTFLEITIYTFLQPRHFFGSSTEFCLTSPTVTRSKEKGDIISYQRKVLPFASECASYIGNIFRHHPVQNNLVSSQKQRMIHFLSLRNMLLERMKIKQKYLFVGRKRLKPFQK